MISTPAEYAELNFYWIRNASEEIARAFLAKVAQYAEWYGRTIEIEAALREIRASLPPQARRAQLRVVR